MPQREIFYLIALVHLPLAHACRQRYRSGVCATGATNLLAGLKPISFLFLLALVLLFSVWHPVSVAQTPNVAQIKNTAAASEFIEADHVRIRWLAPDQFAEDPAAQNATLGIYFEPDPEWHVYWRNPGDSGNRPRFE